MDKEHLNMRSLDVGKLAALNNYISDLSDPEGSLINILHRAQDLFGYIPINLQLHIARKLNIGAAKVNGVVSFYSYFTQEKTGRHVVSVCMGTACYVKGAEKILHAMLDELGATKGKATDDGQFTIRDVRCVGACGLAPVVTVGEKVYDNVTVDDVKRILDEYRGEKRGH